MDTEILWSRFHIIQKTALIAKDVVGMVVDLGIAFTELNSGAQCFFRANTQSADGVSCLTGHKLLPIYAFAELCLHPRILVMSYPNFNTISELKNGTMLRYLSLSFSETEILAALSGAPHYELEIWNWRSSTLLSKVTTDILSDDQLIRCSNHLPLLIGQLATHSTKMIVWECHVSGKKSELIRRQIKFPCAIEDAPFYFSYSFDGLILLINKWTNVYSLNPTTGQAKSIINANDRDCTFETSICSYRGGEVIAASNGQCKFFKRTGTAYAKLWTILPEEPITYLRSYGNERLVGVSSSGVIHNIDVSETNSVELTAFNKYERHITCFAFIYPACECMVTVNSSNALHVVNVENGAVLGKLLINGFSCMRENFVYPFIAIGTIDGTIKILSINVPTNPMIIAELYICNACIQTIRFCEKSLYLIAMDNMHTIYVIKGNVGDRFKILAQVVVQPIVEFNFVVSDGVDGVTVIAILAESDMAGQKLIRVCFEERNLTFKLTEIQLPQMYTDLCLCTSPAHELLAVPYLAAEIHRMSFSTKLNYEIASISKKHETVHQLKHIKLNRDDGRILTWSVDGTISAYSGDTVRLAWKFAAAHRHLGGIQSAGYDAVQQHVAVLAHSGNFYVFKLKNIASDSGKLIAARAFLRDVKVKQMFEKETIGFVPAQYDTRAVWTSIQMEQQQRDEESKFKELRSDIRSHLHALRVKIKSLLDNNESAPNNEKLCVQDFNLDQNFADCLFEQARIAREQEQTRMLFYCKNQQQKHAWIKSLCWDPMDVKGTKVRGIFSNLFAENYALLHQDPLWEQKLNNSLVYRHGEELVAANDAFLPWSPLESSELEFTLNRQPAISDFKSSTETYESLPKQNFVLSGTSSHRFIAPHQYRYDQIAVVTYQQMMLEIDMCFHDCHNLRTYFNKQFEATSDTKESNMTSILLRNGRLREIQNELQTLNEMSDSSLNLNEEILDPKYMADEKPHLVINVEDDEVQAPKYITASRQNLLDLQRAEEERLRLARLADDFRTRALMTMMDGVLEVRFESVLKKNPEMPECMAEAKSSADYDENEIAAVKEYQEKLKELQEERERYRQSLMAEQTKVKQSRDDQIMKFNKKIGELSSLKTLVDAAIGQEELKILRYVLYNFQRKKTDVDEKKMRNAIESLREQIHDLQSTLVLLDQNVKECRSNYENTMQRDRVLEKQFKTSFAEIASISLADQSYKFFRRRPKWIMRAWATSTILTEIAKNVISRSAVAQDRSQLPEECFELLQQIDQLDQYSSAPSFLDQNLWSALCKMRRLKIESEFKVRSSGAILAEAEATMNAFAKEINARKSSLGQKEKKQAELTESKAANTFNRTIQLVVKRGCVEIPLSGSLSDFKSAILLNVSDVEDINKIVKRAGEKKLNTMRKAAVFRRKIIAKEWEHKVYRMTVADMEEFLKIIERCKITKEVQMWLKRKKNGWNEDLSQQALDREIEAAHASYEKNLNEIKKNIDDIEMKIKNSKQQNKKMDQEIAILNVDVTEQQLQKDPTVEEQSLLLQNNRMQQIVERARLVRQVQIQHTKIVELSTLLELQKLKTFPTLTHPSTSF